MPKTCSRPGCGARGIAQLCHLYADLEVEVRPVDDPVAVGGYVLCQTHLDRLKVPKGWRLIQRGTASAATMSPGEIAELAAEIRRVGGVEGFTGDESEATEHSLSSRTNLVTLTSRAHLRLVADAARHGVN